MTNARSKACPKNFAWLVLLRAGLSYVIPRLVQMAFTMPMWPNCCTKYHQTHEPPFPSKDNAWALTQSAQHKLKPTTARIKANHNLTAAPLGGTRKNDIRMPIGFSAPMYTPGIWPSRGGPCKCRFLWNNDPRLQRNIRQEDLGPGSWYPLQNAVDLHLSK